MLLFDRDGRFLAQPVFATDVSDSVEDLGHGLPCAAVEFGQQCRGCVRRHAMRGTADQIQGVGVHDLERHRRQRQQIEHRLADLLQIQEMNQRRGRHLWAIHEPESGFTDHS